MKALKRKPILMSKVCLERQIVSSLETESVKSESAVVEAVDIINNTVNNDASHTNNETSDTQETLIFSAALNFFKFIKFIIFKGVPMLIVLYFILRWVGYDLFPVFGDTVSEFFIKIYIAVRDYLGKELNNI
ncbi:MAG: hypothetical protein GX154_05120 [Clostridiales bacterium]|nr:hypothetical protein [Clostridiales bacterium]